MEPRLSRSSPLTTGARWYRVGDALGERVPPIKREDSQGMKYPAEVLVFWPNRGPVACCTEHASLINGVAIYCEIYAIITEVPYKTKCIICYNGSKLRYFENIAEEKTREVS